MSLEQEMTYFDFRKKFYQEMSGFIMETYADYGINSVEIRQNYKVNLTYDMLSAISNKPCLAFPSLNITSMYEEYRGMTDKNYFFPWMKMELAMAIQDMPKTSDISEIVDNPIKAENIIIQLVNTKQNEEYLKTIPHREFLDLSITYRVLLSAKPDCLMDFTINNAYLEKKHLTEEYLYECAMKNMKEKYTIQFGIIGHPNDIMATSKNSSYVDAKEYKEYISPLYATTNRLGTYGASSMLDTEFLAFMYSVIGSNYYIIPASVNELIFVSEKQVPLKNLAEWVESVNFENVHITQRLSNEVYFYEQEYGCVRLVTDMPNKSLGVLPEIVDGYNIDHYRSLWIEYMSSLQ